MPGNHVIALGNLQMSLDCKIRFARLVFSWTHR